MPEPEAIVQSSWADEIEEKDVTTLPPPTEKIVGNEKIITQFAFNDDGKKVKIVRVYKIEKKLVSKDVARRRALPKFGLSKGDRPGPNPATTVVAEEIFMQVEYP
jgi:translation initiation factor 3 subunit G